MQGLADAAESDLAVIKITSRGLGLHWPRLDVDVWVPGLVQGITGTEAWMAALSDRFKPVLDDIDAAPRTGLKPTKPFSIASTASATSGRKTRPESPPLSIPNHARNAA